MLPLFFHFLQDGFFLEARVGNTIREFLLDRCSLSPETIEKRVSTVLLDGQPVDDLDRAVVRHNSRLALSGAMPGLAGAVMRSNSPLRSFRNSITHHGDEEAAQQTQGLVRLKLFNTVMSELAVRFLGEGILLEPQTVRDFLAELPEQRWNGVTEILLEGESVAKVLLLGENFWAGSDLVSLAVRTQE